MRLNNRRIVQIIVGVALLASTVAVVEAPETEAASKPSSTVIVAIGAENEYANVIQQIGGPYVSVSAVMSNPNTDPHTYEASAKTASLVAGASLIVQNGLGYDDFMNSLESASPNRNRTVITVNQAMDIPNNTPNPHLWYKRNTMPEIASLIAKSLSKSVPKETAYFNANVKKFDQSLQLWDVAIAEVKKSFPNSPVATTEPVADYLLQDLSLVNKTPWSFQAAIMNGTDPSPQDVQTVKNLFTQHKVKIFVYNQQVVDPLTTTLQNLAKANHIPVVGVYETMPLHQTYQSWMINETHDIEKALKFHVSTETMS